MEQDFSPLFVIVTDNQSMQIFTNVSLLKFYHNLALYFYQMRLRILRHSHLSPILQNSVWTEEFLLHQEDEVLIPNYY